MNGGLDFSRWGAGKGLCEAVFNGAMTLEQLEVMLLETAIDKARGNLSSAARMLGLTRPQFAYRLKRLHEDGQSRPQIAPATSTDPSADRS
jgi:DNA-binding NtrC family response regulator